QLAAAPPPPPADARYVAPAAAANASPRIVRCTVHNFPADGATARKCGGLPLALTVNPLAALSDLCEGGKGVASDAPRRGATALGDVYGAPPDGGGGAADDVDYVPPYDDGVPDLERIPVIRDPNGRLDKETKQFARTVAPPRCDRCHAYLNPHCKPVESSSFIRGSYAAPVQRYSCSLCGASGSISIPEEHVASGVFDAAVRCGTAEYEVGGAYCVRERPVENVHLYAVEYVPEEDDAGSGSDHHHHGSVRSHGWREALDAIRATARGLAKTAPRRHEGGGRVASDVRIGVFAFAEDTLVFPYLKRPKPGRSDAGGSVSANADGEEGELAVAMVTDVWEDPFCPLPLPVWTHDVGQGLNSDEWRRFDRVLNSFTELMERLSPAPPPRPEFLRRNCGGAALAALADALEASGGKATLITTRRPNCGVGALRDREATSRGHSPYQRADKERRLFEPVQRVAKFATSATSATSEIEQASDDATGAFYRRLGEKCAAARICVDIVVANSEVAPPPPASSAMASQSSLGPGGHHDNRREFLEVATLAELCRATCGDFKWLRVGNECGVRVGDGDDDDDGAVPTFTAEQLREELRRSALSYSGSDAVFKLRCSRGVRVKSYCPALHAGTVVGDGIVDSAELELARVRPGTTIAVLLEHGVGGVAGARGGSEAPMVLFQAATLYTTATGRRRVRVSTLALPATTVPADVFRSADLGTVAAVATRMAILDLDDGALESARKGIFDKCASILARYRAHTSARSSPAGQLILPESLQLLPLFCLSLRKGRMLRDSAVPYRPPFPTADERAYHLFYGRRASPHMSLQCVHPNLLQVSDMRAKDGEWATPPALGLGGCVDEVLAAAMRPTCQLPRSMNPSIACLDERGMYVLDDRFAFYLFVGKDVPEDKWRELLSVSTESGAQRLDGRWVANVPAGTMAVANTEAGRKLRGVLRQLRSLNAPNPTLALDARHARAPLVLVFVGRGSVFEGEMDSLLVDDPDGKEKGYVDFLCDVHREVRKVISEEL
ncbi:hypothetical protein ACHAWF_013085, partial [Thalassiosira exigua]